MEPAQPYRLDNQARRVFVGLMLGMFVAAVSQTIVGPAMPRIVAELGGMDHYSWVATAAMLVSAIIVPIVGKLSDLYGRRVFYLGGLAVFMIGSIISGSSVNFWMLVAGRAVQGMGMGTLLPLSQTIIGDIIPPRQRGKYQGVMGAVFGFTSVAGPVAGGFITEHWGWRWLFFVAIPIGLITSFVIARFLKLEHEQRHAPIDWLGMATLTPGLVCILLATSWGGTTYPWGSPVIIGLFVAGTILLVGFVVIETRASEPIIPLRIFRNPVLTFANLSAFCIAMVMFGMIIYAPVFAQGVLGMGATGSGLVLMPLMLTNIVVGIGAGYLVTKLGRYKELMLIGLLIMGLGQFLTARLDHRSSPVELALCMVAFGTGLGMCMQLYTLVVQNAAARRDLGVATASTQFFRNVGSTVGVAIFGTIMSTGLQEAIAKRLAPELLASLPAGGVDVGSVLDPGVLASLPPAVVDAVRQGLAERMHGLFLLGLPILAVAFAATMLIKAIPLRDTVHTRDEAGRDLLDTMAQSSPVAGDVLPGLGREGVGARTRERILGLQFDLLALQASRDDRPLLRRAVTDLGNGDSARGIALLTRTAAMLRSEDNAVAARAEKYAAEVAERARGKGGLLRAELRTEIARRAAERNAEAVLSIIEPTVAERHHAVNIAELVHAANDLAAALLVDGMAPDEDD